MDLHHPPCRGYRANQAFYAYGRMAHMLLRAVQYRLLPKTARRHGIRPLVRHVMRTVARLVTSGRRRSLLFASCCVRRDWLFFASLQLEGGWTPRRVRPTVAVGPDASELYIRTVSAAMCPALPPYPRLPRPPVALDAGLGGRRPALTGIRGGSAT